MCAYHSSVSGTKVDTLGTLLAELCKRQDYAASFGHLEDGSGRLGGSGSSGGTGFGISSIVRSFSGLSPRKRTTQTQKVLELIDEDDELEEVFGYLDSGSNLEKLGNGAPGNGASVPGTPLSGASPLRQSTSSSTTPNSSLASSSPLASDKLRFKRHREYRQLQRLATTKQACYTQSQQALHDYVGSEARELGGAAFTRFMNDLYTRVFHLVNSTEASERLGGVRAIDALIDVSLLGENATKISRFANYLRDIFQPSTDALTLAAAAKALGHLVHSGGPVTADVVEFEVKRALEWLQGERVEYKRLAAVLILKELAKNSPTVFNVHVAVFIRSIWSGLRDPKLSVRRAAISALRACLVVVEKRETRYRVKWYYELFEETKRGARKGSSGADSVHGSLLVIGELLRHTGEFMLARYREVVEMVLQYRDSREKIIKSSVVSLLPRVAAFAPERFAESYLEESMTFLLNALKSSNERPAAFSAIGQMAQALGHASVHATKQMGTHLTSISTLIRDVLVTKKGKKICVEAIECVGALAQGLGHRWKPYCISLMDTIFQTGMSSQLVSALEKIAQSLPELLPDVRDRLLQKITQILYRKETQSRSQGAEPTCLALRTLGIFDFGETSLLEFVKSTVLSFLDDAIVNVRQEAALTCCDLLEGHLMKGYQERNGVLKKYYHINRVSHSTLEVILGKLLMVAITDIDPSVRTTVLLRFKDTSTFDKLLSQADMLQASFNALNDEAFSVREVAIELVGRLATMNPAYVLPALRRLLLQLLTDLEYSADSKHKEDSARLLGNLIDAAPRLVLPYVSPVLKSLVNKLKPVPSMQGMGNVTGGGETGVAIAVLSTIGKLALVGGNLMRSHVPQLLPLLIASLQDSSSAARRDVAVSTMGDLIESTGYVVAPYTDYPQLLGVLLKLLNESSFATRHKLIKLLGILGSFDPHEYKVSQNVAASEKARAPENGRSKRFGENANAGGLYQFDLHDSLPSFGLVTSSDEYYPTVAINVLMQVLHDGSMKSHHLMVIRSLMFIFQALGIKCVQYFPTVMPILFHVAKNCDEGLRQFIFQQFTLLVSITKQHLGKYLDDILSLVQEYWGSETLMKPILQLLEQLSHNFHDEFRTYLPQLLPRIVTILADAERRTDYTYVSHVLHAIESFGSSIEDNLHILLPALMRLISPNATATPMEIRRTILESLARILKGMKLSGYGSAIVQPLARILSLGPESLKRTALDTICAAAVSLGEEFSFFVPSIRKLLIAQNIHHDIFEAIASCLALSEPPCTVDTIDYNANTTFDFIMKTKMNGHAPDKLDILPTPELKYSVNELNLKKAWESSQRSTKEDWVEWMRHFSVELLKESPSPALRACYTLAQVQPHTAKDLFAAGFISCWSELSSNSQQQLIRSLEAAFNSPTIPTEIVTSLLNLAEFMEHDGKPLQVDFRMLGALAERCHAFAKALHYKEMEFQELPESCVEALISIYNQLNQPDAAVGVLANAQQELQVELKESWYEKLQQWDEALEAYRKKQANSTKNSAAALEAALGCLRCLAALAEWEELSKLCRDIWMNADVALRRELAPTAAHAAWHMGQWNEMAEYVSMIESSGNLGSINSTGTPGVTGPMVNVAATSTFLHAVLKIHNGEINEGLMHIEQSRELLATELTARVGESYERAYGDMVRVQQLVELEEVIEYSTIESKMDLTAADSRKSLIRKMWHDRLWGVQRNVEVWQALLSVRSLVLPVSEDSGTWLKFASLCRKSGRLRQSKRTLIKLLNYNPGLKSAGESGYGAGSGAPQAMYAYCKYLWSIGNFSDAYDRLQELSQELKTGSNIFNISPNGIENGAHRNNIFQSNIHSGKPPLQARVYLKRGLWHWSLVQDEMNEKCISEILSSLRAATESARGWSKAWHHWALFNVAAMEYHSSQAPSAVARHVAPAVLGFFRSIALSQSINGRRGSSGNLQDILRLLTLWFNHGDQADVEAALIEGFGHVSIDTWLLVIPQIIARIHTNSARVRQLIQSLFMRIGRHHPQALMYPLLVACKSSSSSRRAAAMSVLDNVRQHSATLVEQAQLVSQELIRMAVLWHEMWHEALEDASRLYFGENNVDAMLNVLLPLHVLLEKNGPETLQEIAFIQAYGRELQEAHEWCNKYRVSRKEAELHQAWDLYYHVFKRINKQLPSLTTLQLQYVAPALVRAQGLELAVPGTYVAGEPVVTISSFAPQLNVITSKQRPRKLTIHGGDGSDYVFLLKGHEDLRQDERVMQLFGLVNTLLQNDRNTSEHDLSIARYSVTPLSPNSGLIGWVPNCDTLHTLIREFREARKIPLNIEHRLMMAMAPDYEHLPLINKVEVFEHALNETTGDDLAKVLWLKSRTSEVWLDRRTNYTRSLAVMSVVGYILGLGDRHPSNLMLDRHSGKILHIDFGDCFEASMNREKFPEKVPFRLTRMLVQAMGVSGVEGNYRSTSEKVMLVLRSNKDSVMAMLEAFVHDPLINWRLLQKTDTEEVKKESQADPEEALNERAVAVMKRLSDKLTGRDFSPDGESIESDSVPAQVQRLVQQATSHECLCQNYIGWCPFW